MRVAVFLLGFLLQGCGFGVMMAGSGVSKAGTAKVMDSYNTYIFEMERINLEREKLKLSPRPILSKKEWLNGQKEEDGESLCEPRFEDCEREIK